MPKLPAAAKSAYNEQGFSVNSVIFFVSVFSLLVFFGWHYLYNPGISVLERFKDVKGVSTANNAPENPGFSVCVTSEFGNWDLVEYLCESLAECKTSLDSGEKWATVSGGETENHQIFVESESSWEEYVYMKVFVRSGWGSQDRKFVMDATGDVLGSNEVTLEETKILIFPVSSVIKDYAPAASFSDAVLE